MEYMDDQYQRFIDHCNAMWDHFWYDKRDAYAAMTWAQRREKFKAEYGRATDDRGWP